MKKILYFLTARHPLLTFLVLMTSALLFGLMSFDLFYLLKANIELVEQYGRQALMDGAMDELLKLLAYGTLSAFFYVIFKAAEKSLVDTILKK